MSLKNNTQNREETVLYKHKAGIGGEEIND